MSSIYVSISSMEDEELIPTIKDLFAASSGKHEINVGIYLTYDDKKFFKRVKRFLNKYKSIRFIHQVVTEENCTDVLGLGVSRNMAMSMYSGEDYILQVDSHSYFADEWDDTAISLHKNATEQLGHDKIIITAYAGMYSLIKRRFGNKYDRYYSTHDEQGLLRYSFFVEDDFIAGAIPRYADSTFSKISDSKANFVPAAKVAANFLFTTGDFAGIETVPKDTVFFSEVSQSINIIDNGYMMVFPNITKPLVSHYYFPAGNNFKNRKTIGDYQEKYGVDFEYIMFQSLTAMMTAPENQNKIQKYIDYCGFNILTGKFKNDKMVIPDYF